jgi:hypothetical protein
MSQAVKTIKDDSITPQIQHRICCNKAKKNYVKIIERILNDVPFHMKVCSLHVEEYSDDGKEVTN